MVILSTLVVLTALSTPQETKVFRDPRLGLTFEYPGSWNLRRENLFQILEFQVQSQRVTVQMINTDFRGTTEQWQQGMRDVNRASNREVLRQSEEELLGVPLLLTLATEVVAGQRRTYLLGLLYSRSNEKLNFRLTAPTEVFQEAERQWRECLLSMRTLSGDLPRPEDGTESAPTPGESASATPKRQTVWTPGQGRSANQATERLSLNASYDVLVPTGWRISEGQLKTTTLKGRLTVDGFQGGRSSGETTWSRLLREDLSQFKIVRRREEPRPQAFATGYQVQMLWRSGEASSGTRASFLAIGIAETRHWTLRYEGGDPATLQADLPLLRTLVTSLQIEPKS
ncbi:MAG: hypothetical protein MUC92_09295 [Fimbriimonadaceae bacterium]|jgi:hypothetical protein|nr:hypothetical protein [Fimbriimonadaceae bacterium]